jgi:hypothetical protein
MMACVWQANTANSLRYFEPQIEFLCAKHAFNFLMNDRLVSTPGHIATQLITNYVFDSSPTHAHATASDISALLDDFSKCATINVIQLWCQVAQSSSVLLSKEQIINSCDTVDDSSSLVSQCMDNHSS